MIPTAMTKQKLLQKNLGKTADQNDVTDIVKVGIFDLLFLLQEYCLTG